MEFLIFQLVLITSCTVTEHYRAESGSVLFTPPVRYLYTLLRWIHRDLWEACSLLEWQMDTKQNTPGLLRQQQMPRCGPLN